MKERKGRRESARKRKGEKESRIEKSAKERGKQRK